MKKREESKLIEKNWTDLSRGQALTETEEQTLVKLFSQDIHRKLFLALFSKIEINLNEIPLEQIIIVKESMVRVLESFLNEVFLYLLN